MSRVLLDTTYMLPAVGVGVGERLDHTLAAAQDAGHETWVSDISLFELLAKGAKLVKAGKLPEEKLMAGVRSIMADDTVEKASAYGEQVAAASIGLRRFHNDFVDCLIIASAMEHCDALVSEDDFATDEGLLRFVRERRPEFRFMTSMDFR
ncbi:MAG: PIN domain-containing protein [Nitrososphaerota archaeon]|nr:PIN domain-containing protein [Nitrososphaerota archaeon]MDG6957804.1 PIN domain-containing protein [Nitrososphaerota archaeon]MDG6960593.1 PIN domain-containing protein [Nitrososphaerota archaeon]MDG6965452.1 PIN domain-containing protein [Nitrososphaerota archaeon]MDG6987596.1 PIN domain-containing protein [Nitrososphaerota archaeon]